jgi:hypothetical protein
MSLQRLICCELVGLRCRCRVLHASDWWFCVDIIQEETAQDVARFRFNERWSLGVDSGERAFVWVGIEAESVAIQCLKRVLFSAAIEGGSGGVVGIVFRWMSGCLLLVANLMQSAKRDYSTLA